MARTEITYHETYVTPGEAIVVDHDADHTVMVFDGECVMGGSEHRWLMRWALVGPAVAEGKTALVTEYHIRRPDGKTIRKNTGDDSPDGSE